MCECESLCVLWFFASLKQEEATKKLTLLTVDFTKKYKFKLGLIQGLTAPPPKKTFSNSGRRAWGSLRSTITLITVLEYP